MRYPLDTSDQKALNEYSEIQSDIEAVWIEAYPRMIMASDKAEMKKIYQAALQKTYEKGASRWLEYRNRCFKAYKEELGISYAWPKADPSYVAPEVTLFGGASKYMIDVPEYISWAE